MRRVSDFLMMMALGLTAVVALLWGVAGSGRFLGPMAPIANSEHFWAISAVAGFLLGLCWRFLFWDLPGMTWHLLVSHRRNLQYIFVLLLGMAVLVFI